MTAAQGFTEVSNYSFVSQEMIDRFHLRSEDHVQVKNPIASDQNFLRTSLLPGIWKNITDNARHLDSFRLFEIGREIHFSGEVPHLAAAVYAKDDGATGLFELKRLAECLIPGVEAVPVHARATEHPRRAAELKQEGHVVGRLSELHPNLVEAGRAAVLDLDLTKAEAIRAQRSQPGALRYKALRRFPSSAFDLSVVVPERGLIGAVQSDLQRMADSHLLSISFLRDFALPDRSRSVSFRLTVGAVDRTLSADEVGAMRQQVIDGMREAGYELRA
jgi:phenylalanyl-tRNA synthetase beta chain